MKRFSLFLTIVLTAILSSISRDFKYTYQGKTIVYTVIDEDAKTVETRAGYYNAGNSVSGDLILPDHPLEDGIIEYTLVGIGDYAFWQSNLTNIVIPNTVTTIGKFAFYDCGRLSNVTIPNSVTLIDQSAFDSCSWLTEATLGTSVTTIEKSAFWGCMRLTNIEIPNSLIKIGNSSFAWCTSLKNVEIPNSVKEIEVGAFGFCSNLTNIKIPGSVTKLEAGVFENCSNLLAIDVANDNPYYSSNNGVLFNKDKTKLIEFPGGITGIYEIPMEVQSIEGWAFFGCDKLTSITIPSSVSKIENYAFWNCSSLVEIKCFAVIPPLLKYDIFNQSRLKLFIPKGSITAYNDSSWAQYFDTIEELPGTLSVVVSGDGKVYNAGFRIVENGDGFDGSDITFFVIPDDGNHISAITLEGEDIMSNLVNHKLSISDFEGDGDGFLRIEFAPDVEAALTVRGADNFSLTHSYKEGTKAKIVIFPDEGWKIHSATYNGEDVTDRIENNEFVTEPLRGDNTLNFVLVNDVSASIVNIDSTNPVHISAVDSKVVINGLVDNETVSVYNLSGKTIYSGFDREIKLEVGNVYLITVHGKTYKVIL